MSCFYHTIFYNILKIALIIMKKSLYEKTYSIAKDRSGNMISLCFNVWKNGGH